MTWETKDLIALYAALLSTATASVGLLGWLLRKRVRLATTFFWTTQEGGADEITIANLSDVPINVSGYKLRWQRQFLKFSRKPIDIEPYSKEPFRFKIDGRSVFSLGFNDPDKFDWSWRTSNGRKLVLTLFIFGRRRPKRLVITRGSYFS